MRGQQYYVVSNETPGLDVLDQDGSVVRLWPSPSLAEPRAVRDADIQHMRDLVLSMDDSNGLLEELFEGMEFPDQLPYYGWASWEGRSLVVSSDEAVWVLRFGGLDGDLPVWDRFSLRTGEVTQVSSPDDLDLLAVDEERVAVLRRGPYDEEIVEVRRIIW